MNSKTLSIGVLSITALILFLAQFIPVQPVLAAQVIKGSDYSLIAAKSAPGGDIIYVVDNRSGQVAVFKAWYSAALIQWLMLSNSRYPQPIGLCMEVMSGFPGCTTGRASARWTIT